MANNTKTDTKPDWANQRDPIRAAKPNYEKTGARPVEDVVEDEQISKLRGESGDLITKVTNAKAVADQAAAEYAALVNQATLKNAELMKLVGTTPKRPLNIAEYSEQEKKRGARLVTVMIPHAFQIRLDDHTLIEVLPGARKLPEDLAGHWWLLANGCNRVEI